jgi:hypothetical protein
MPEFGPKSIARISNAVRTVEHAMGDVRGLPNKGAYPPSWRWFVLTTNLDAETYTATASMYRWSAKGNSGDGKLTVSSLSSTVIDSTKQFGVVEGDWVLCRPLSSVNHYYWEIVSRAGSSTPTHWALLGADLEYGDSVGVTVTLVYGGSGSSISGVLPSRLLPAGSMFPSGAEVLIQYFDGHWWAIQGPCPEEIAGSGS